METIKEFIGKRGKRIILSNDIMIEGELASAGSKMLEGFKALFSASIVKSVRTSGYEIGCLVKPSEFGLYNITEGDGRALDTIEYLKNNDLYSYYCTNDYSGAAKFFAAKEGLYFLHPTYGRVSRFGLVPAVSSMDQIGIAGKNPDEIFKLLETLSGRDGQDMTADFEAFRTDAPQKAGKSNFVTGKVSSVDDFGNLPLSAVFLILSSAELSGNLSRYDGIKFGYRTSNYADIEELYRNSRGEGFSFYTKLIAVLGTAVLSKDYYSDYYDKALRLRREIKNKAEEMLERAGGPVAFEFDLSKAPDLQTIGLLTLPALSGLPALSMKYGGKGRLVIAEEFAENDLLHYLKALKGKS